jgi:hypothetical protein
MAPTVFVIIVAIALGIRAMMVVVVNFRAAYDRANHPADNGAWGSGNHRACACSDCRSGKDAVVCICGRSGGQRGDCRADDNDLFHDFLSLPGGMCAGIFLAP